MTTFYLYKLLDQYRQYEIRDQQNGWVYGNLSGDKNNCGCYSFGGFGTGPTPEVLNKLQAIRDYIELRNWVSLKMLIVAANTSSQPVLVDELRALLGNEAGRYPGNEVTGLVAYWFIPREKLLSVTTWKENTRDVAQVA